MNIICIIQARMGSTRLPGKILKKIKDKPMLDYVIERVKLSTNINNTVLATTESSKDDVVVDYAKRKKINYFRGSEDDVLSRYYYAAIQFKGQIIIRISADDPLIDPEIIDQVIDLHLETNADYTTNNLIKTFPLGSDVEVFNFQALEYAFNNAKLGYQREHVTPFIKENSKRFKLENYEAKGKLRRPDIRITVDTKEDFELIKLIILHFNNNYFITEDIINFLETNSHLLNINKHIQQNVVKNN